MYLNQERIDMTTWTTPAGRKEVHPRPGFIGRLGRKLNIRSWGYIELWFYDWAEEIVTADMLNKQIERLK